MFELTIRFSEQFENLNRRRSTGKKIIYPLNRRASIKDIVESLGVPHTEIGSISVEGNPVDFGFVPLKPLVITVDPIRPPFDATRPSVLRPEALKTVRFIVDVNVGKLAVLLRIAGLDTAYGNDYGDADIARMAEDEGRIVLSKDAGLLKRKQIVFGRYVRAIHPDDQLREMVDFFGLQDSRRAFSRCVRCNSELIRVEKNQILSRLEPKTKKYFHRFKLCAQCDRIYWRGSHHDQMKIRLGAAGIRI